VTIACCIFALLQGVFPVLGNMGEERRIPYSSVRWYLWREVFRQLGPESVLYWRTR